MTAQYYDCTCAENDCPNVFDDGIIDYHHPNGGCIDCDCEATPPEVEEAEVLYHFEPIIRPEPCTKHGPGLPGTRCPCSLPCPQCDAPAGQRCRRPSEHEAPEMHVRRAVAAEFVDSLCGHAYTVEDYTSRGLHVPPFAIGPRASTVKRVDLWGAVTDTHQTEAELNGFRATQGALL